jgi:hypothetical protein
LVSTPRGLFIGSNNYFYGLNVWRATFGDDGGYKLFLPLVGGRGQDGSAPPPVVKPQTPENIQAEIIADRPETKACETQYENDYADYVVSWTPLPEATAYRVYRADFLLDGHFPTLGYDPGFQVPGPFKLIATTEKPYYVDDNNGNCERLAGDIYQYRIVALNTEGVSRPSIVVRVPNLQTPLTFRGLENTLKEWAAQSPTTEQGINSTVRPALVGAETAVRAGDLVGARQRLEQLQQTLAGTVGLMEPWRREDLGLLLDKLIRRVELVQLNILAANALQ